MANKTPSKQDSKFSILDNGVHNNYELFNQMNTVARVGGWEYHIESQKFYGTTITKELLGVHPDYEINLKKDTSFFKEGENRDKMLTSLHLAMTEGISFDLELLIINKQGEELWTRTMCQTEIIDGKPVRLLGIFQDIDDKKKAQIQIKRSKELLDRTNKVALIGGWEFEIDTNIFTWTSFTKELLGVDQDYIPKIDNEIILYKKGAHQDKAIILWQNAITQGVSFDEELIITNHRGREFWSRVICDVEIEDGKPKRLIGIFQDIDKQKKIELDANKTKILLENILDSATDVGIVATDKNHIIKVFNPGAENLFGYSSKDIVNIKTPGFLHDEQEVSERRALLEKNQGKTFSNIIEIVKHYSRLDKKDANKWTYVKKDGSKIMVQMKLLKLRDHEGEHIGYLGIAIDISDLNSAKSSLEILSNNLQKKNKQLLNFAQITSHNLRSPVINLNSLLMIYEESENTEDQEIIFTHFKKVIGNLSDTLDELVETLRLQEDVNKKASRLKFSDIFEKTKETLAGQILESKTIVTADFKEVDTIVYPKSYLESIILNLFTNAIKYRSQERISKIDFITKRTEKGIILSVEDNGLGIDMKKNGDQLFGFHKTFHRHPEAKGLGLFMTKIQVEAMGGSISVKSEVNKGTTFSVVFLTNKKYE